MNRINHGEDIWRLHDHEARRGMRYTLQSDLLWLADELEKRQREHAISMGTSDFSCGAEHAYRAAQLTLRQIINGWFPDA